MESPKKQMLLTAFDYIWNKRDIDSAAPFYHDAMAYYGPRMTIEGKSNYLEVIKSYMSVVTDSKFTMLEMVEEGDRIGCHGRLTGKHSGPYGEIPATHANITIEFMSFITFKDNKIIAETEVFDEFGLMMDMGMEFVQKEHA
ncbi:ester cyclase [Fulvivirga sedimenti]|uniref:Ester cyclase n=1 Tax=Fulvivirga sedimenti TaxID=2879465 RepID=A0A9X1HVR1_9BACT|nr:ester cyclase [Fulvivirga sedimenti]MCA6078825.1 ester cyclase [Fulvivirga sedimenti]